METQQVVNGCDIFNTLRLTSILVDIAIGACIEDVITLLLLGIGWKLLGIGGKVPFGSLWLVPFQHCEVTQMPFT